jgi:hypothetical protein
MVRGTCRREVEGTLRELDGGGAKMDFACLIFRCAQSRSMGPPRKPRPDVRQVPCLRFLSGGKQGSRSGLRRPVRRCIPREPDPKFPAAAES